jgi:hypothetical protein|tara:strand:- start:67 stop:435 length:369 start_codon:yes stop_codon:yes gene_type:complete
MPYIVGPTNISQLSMPNAKVSSGIRTTTSTGAAALVTLTAADFQSVDYQVQVVKGTSYNSAMIKVIHDGTTAYMTEYGNVNQPDVGIATFSADINSGDLRLLGFPDSSDSTTFKVIFSAIKS